MFENHNFCRFDLVSYTDRQRSLALIRTRQRMSKNINTTTTAVRKYSLGAANAASLQQCKFQGLSDFYRPQRCGLHVSTLQLSIPIEACHACAPQGPGRIPNCLDRRCTSCLGASRRWLQVCRSIPTVASITWCSKAPLALVPRPRCLARG